MSDPLPPQDAEEPPVDLAELARLLRQLLHEAARSRAGEGFLSKREAAAYLGISPERIDRLRADSKLACFKLGHTVHFRRADLDALMEAHRIEAVNLPPPKPAPPPPRPKPDWRARMRERA